MYHRPIRPLPRSRWPGRHGRPPATTVAPRGTLRGPTSAPAVRGPPAPPTGVLCLFLDAKAQRRPLASDLYPLRHARPRPGMRWPTQPAGKAAPRTSLPTEAPDPSRAWRGTAFPPPGRDMATPGACAESSSCQGCWPTGHGEPVSACPRLCVLGVATPSGGPEERGSSISTLFDQPQAARSLTELLKREVHERLAEFDPHDPAKLYLPLIDAVRAFSIIELPFFTTNCDRTLEMIWHEELEGTGPAIRASSQGFASSLLDVVLNSIPPFMMCEAAQESSSLGFTNSTEPSTGSGRGKESWSRRTSSTCKPTP